MCPSFFVYKANDLFTTGADVNRQTTVNDHTVLSLACAGGHLAVVELLLAHGADPLHRLKVRTVSLSLMAVGHHHCLVAFVLNFARQFRKLELVL